MTTLYIYCELVDKTKIVKNPKFIPALGESVDFGFSPAPKVTNILHIYEKEQIYVQVK